MTTGVLLSCCRMNPSCWGEDRPSLANLTTVWLARRDDHSMMGETKEGDRPRSWEVYAGMHGNDSLCSGVSKRTPTGGFFTS